MRRTRERPRRREPAPGASPSRHHPSLRIAVVLLASIAAAGCGGVDGPGPPPPAEPGTPRPAPASARATAIRCTTENAQRQMLTMVRLGFREGLGSFDIALTDGWCGKHRARDGLMPAKSASSLTNTDGREVGVELGTSPARRTGRYLARLHQFAYGIGCGEEPGEPVRLRLAPGIRRATLPDGTTDIRGGAPGVRFRGRRATWDPGVRCEHTGTLVVEAGYGRGALPPTLPPVVWFGASTAGARIAMGPGEGGRGGTDGGGSDGGRPALDARGKPAPGAISPRGFCSYTSGAAAEVCANGREPGES